MAKRALSRTAMGIKNASILMKVITNEVLKGQSKATVELKREGSTAIISVKKFEFFFRAYVSSSVKYMVRINTLNFQGETEKLSYYVLAKDTDRDDFEKQLKKDFSAYLRQLFKLEYGESYLGSKERICAEKLLEPIVYLDEEEA